MLGIGKVRTYKNFIYIISFFFLFFLGGAKGVGGIGFFYIKYKRKKIFSVFV